MPADQLEGIDDGAMQGVVRAELERTQQQWQHATIVGAVRVADDRLEMASIDGGRGFSLGHQVVQGGFAGDGEDDVAHRAVGSGQARRASLNSSAGLPETRLRSAISSLSTRCSALAAMRWTVAIKRSTSVSVISRARTWQKAASKVARIAVGWRRSSRNSSAATRRRWARSTLAGSPRPGRQASRRLQGRELGDFVGHALWARPSRPGAQHEKRSAAGVSACSPAEA